MNIYLDNNASTQPLPAVIKAMIESMTINFGNPSSAHSVGDRARKKIEAARKEVAALIGGQSENLYFTGSGTEANNLAIFSAIGTEPSNKHFVTTRIEHSSILKLALRLENRGCKVTYLDVNDLGRVNGEELANLLEREPADLVSVQWVNSETGVIQPIEELARICSDKKTPFHTDAAQAIGKMDIDIAKVPAQYICMTGHKFHGPQGCGAIITDGAHIEPMCFGGDQESAVRPGTENMSGIIGIGEAAKIRRMSLSESIKVMNLLRNALETQLLNQLDFASVNGDVANRISNTTNIKFHGIDGQALIVRLDRDGVQCSQSSACMNHRPEASYVLRAMGLSEPEAYSSIRFSVSVTTTMEEINQAAKMIIEHAKKLKSLSVKAA